MEELGGKNLIHFVPAKYAENAQSIYDALGIKDLTLQNVWHIFGNAAIDISVGTHYGLSCAFDNNSCG
jgi:hypothetical protein